MIPKLIATLVLATIGLTSVRAEETSSAGDLVWCGLDYSKVKMIGTTDFTQPSQIFPGMLEAWNGLFMTEMLPQLEKMAKSVKTDLQAVQANNAKASESQIERKDGSKSEMVDPSDIKESDIAALVSGYALEKKAGTGLVFVMDRLVKAQETGCLYVVFFDIGSRKVLHSERMVEKAGGFGFRNFWFSPVKNAVKKLPKIYKTLKPKA